LTIRLVSNNGTKDEGERQFLHVQQLDLFLFLFSSFKGVPSTIERIALFKEKKL
jgi:hypothetical protein